MTKAAVALRLEELGLGLEGTTWAECLIIVVATLIGAALGGAVVGILNTRWGATATQLRRFLDGTAATDGGISSRLSLEEVRFSNC